jgi:hypothetical protein
VLLAATSAPLFTCAVADPTGVAVLAFTISNAAANTIFGNFTGSSGAPSYNAMAACGDATHALSWVPGTGFACQAISTGTTQVTQVNGTPITTQSPENFQDTSTVTWTNPSAGNIQAAAVPEWTTLSTPTAPTCTTNGVAGSTSYSYAVVGCEDGPTCAYHSPATSACTIGTGNATLTSSNSINIKTYADTLYGYRCYNIYRTAAAGTPSTTGLIGNCVWKSFIDTGLAGDSTTAPATNTTRVYPNQSPLPGCNSPRGAPFGIDAPPCSPNILDDEFTWGNGTWSPGDANSPFWTRIGTWTNTTATLTNGMVIVSELANNTNFSCLMQAVPGSTPYAFRAFINPNVQMGINSTNSNAGFGFYEQATSKLVIVEYTATSASGGRITVGKWTLPATFSAFTVDSQSSFAGFPYIELSNNGTNTIYKASPNGVDYQQILSEAKNTFFTTGPSHVGFCVEAGDATHSVDVDADFMRRTQ